jgi:transcription antitermination factor NusG
MEAEQSSYPWYALRVRSRHEKMVAAHLRAKSQEWFLPMYRCRHRWSDRIKEIDAPFFPGYVFCRVNLSNRLPILTIPGVVMIVGSGRTPVPVDEAEIADLQAAVKSGVPAEPWPFLQIGQTVRIEQGPLRGLEGILLDFRGQHRLVLSVTVLKRSVAVQVDKAWTRPVPAQHQPRTGPATPYRSSRAAHSEPCLAPRMHRDALGSSEPAETFSWWR